jgi:NosR/NirI family nitrous oxide reductase transcriptional regulator
VISTFLAGLGLGLTQAPMCLGTCAPLAFAVVTGAPAGRPRRGLGALLLFLAGRAFGYLALGAVAGALAARITMGDLQRPLGAAFVALAAALWLGAFGVAAADGSWACRLANGPGRVARSPLLLGALSGFQVCPPLLLALGVALQGGGILHGLAHFAGFFLGTSAGLLPFAAWPWIGVRLPAGWLARLRAALPLVVGFFFLCWGMDRLVPPPTFDLTVTEADLREVLPGADRFIAVPPSRCFEAYRGEGGAKAGACFVTSQVAPAASAGYGGPLPALVGLSTDGTITGVKLLAHRETPVYVARLEDPSYLARFRGRNVTEPLRLGGDVDAVTAATVSAEALCNGSREAGRTVAAERFGIVAAAPDAAAPSPWRQALGGWRIWLLAGYLLAAPVVATRWRRGPARAAVLGASVVVLGLVLTQFFSIGHVVMAAAGLWPSLPGGLAWYVLAGGVLLITLFAGRLYCAALCPFGALTDLLGRLWPAPMPVPPRVSRLLRPLRFVLLVATPVAYFVWRRLTVVDYEPFAPTFAVLTGRGIPADAALTGLLVLIGVLSLVSRRFWCVHLCPAGAAMEVVARVQVRREAGGVPDGWLEV